MREFLFELKREIKRIIHDRDLLMILVVAPLFYAIFYGSTYSKKFETELPVAVVKHNNSELTNKIISDLIAHPSIDVILETDNFEQAKHLLQKEAIYGIVEFENDFDKNLKKGKHANVGVLLNTTRFLVSNDINKAVNEVIAKYNYGIRLKYINSKLMNSGIGLKQIMPVITDIKPLFNPLESYGDFLIPGVLLLILHQTLLIATGESMSTENKIINGSTISNFNKNFLAKGIPYFTLFAIYAVIFLAIILPSMGLSFTGSISAAAVLTILFLINSILAGFIIGILIRNKKNVLIILAFSSYPIFLISGYSWLHVAMPSALPYLSYLIPATPYLLGMSKVVSSGALLNNIIFELTISSLQAILLFVTINIIHKRKQSVR